MAKKKAEEKNGEESASLDFAMNPVKLARAKTHVTLTQPDLKEGTNEHTQAVKDRYVEIGGALTSDAQPKAGKKGSRVVNMAQDDGSEDIDNDEE